MKYVVCAAATAAAFFSLLSAGVDASEWQYWAISIAFQMAGYCTALILK